MTTTTTESLNQLVGAVRHRLWMRAVRGSIHVGAWVGAVLVGLSATVHLFFYPLTSSIGFAIGLIPLLGALLMAVLQRPSMQQSAMAADDWFDGKALITTAWELRGVSNPNPTQAVIAHRAERNAQRYRAVLDERTPAPPSHSPGPPLLIAATGLFFLTLPGAATDDAIDTRSGEPRLAERVATSAHLRHAGEPARNPVWSMIGSPGARTTDEDGRDPASPHSSPVRSGVVSGPQTEVGQTPRPAASGLIAAGGGPAAGSTAGDGRRIDRAGTSIPASTPNTREIRLSRRGQSTGNERTHPEDLLNTPVDPTAQTGSATPTVATTAIAVHRPALTQAQRSYTERYFNQLDGKP